MIYKQYFEEFINKLDKKMEKGHYEHGDNVFSRQPEKILEELEAELLDICGWGLVLWVRLQKMKEELNKQSNKK